MLIWIPICVGAAVMQVARNAVQRDLLTQTGPWWAASLVRFLFGIPFTLMFVLIAKMITPQAHGMLSLHLLMICSLGALTQIVAQAALLVCMERSSFAIGSAFFQTSLPFTAVVGAGFLHDPLRPWAWFGIVIVTAGLAVLSWPKRKEEELRDWSPILLGLTSGVFTALSANAVRQGGLLFEPHYPVYSALFCLLMVQTIQSLVLGGVLGLTDRVSLRAAFVSLRSAIGSGFGSSAASGLWFVAYTLVPAALARAVGVVEIPLAAITGRRIFAEKLTLLQIVAGMVTAAGVVLAAVG